MSLHRLSRRHRVPVPVAAHLQRRRRAGADTPLTSYYTATGYPPGRWVGTGMAGIGGTTEVAGPVTEQAMEAVFGTAGTRSPAIRWVVPTASRGRWRPDRSPGGRLGEMQEPDRAAAVGRIGRKRSPVAPSGAVAGFDLTFTAPKSASVLWAVADGPPRPSSRHAHRAAVAEVLSFVEQRALFTRAGARGRARRSPPGGCGGRVRSLGHPHRGPEPAHPRGGREQGAGTRTARGAGRLPRPAPAAVAMLRDLRQPGRRPRRPRRWHRWEARTADRAGLPGSRSPGSATSC